MTVTGNVVKDLLPVYLAGEASPDTVALVEEYLARNPELRGLVDDVVQPAVHDVPAPADLELRALTKTRRLLSRKNWLLGAAVFFTMLPFSFLVRDEGITFVLYRDAPLQAMMAFVVGLAAWVGLLLTLRRLNHTGLRAPRSLGVRLGWALAGCLIGAVGVLIAEQLGAREWQYWRALRSWLPGAVALLAVWLGEQLNRVATLDELHRPLTLFDDQR